MYVYVCHLTTTGEKFGEAGFVLSKKDGDGAMCTTNSVRKHEELNCKICDHKLDPLYLVRLQKYLQYKIDNPTRCVDFEKGDDDDETEGNTTHEKQCTIINGRAFYYLILSYLDNENKEIILLGDNNCDITVRTPNSTTSNDTRHIKNLYELFGFTQLIKDPTRVTNTSSTIIDHIATTNVDKF